MTNSADESTRTTSRFSIGLKTKILLGAVVPLAATAIIMAGGLNNFQTAFRSGILVDRSHNIIRTSQALEKSAVDMNTGMRGFLLTGDPAFLKPYVNGAENVAKLFEELRNEVADSPSQLELLAEMQRILEEWRTKVAAPAIALRNEIGEVKDLHDLAKIVRETKGAELFDEFRDRVGQILAAERESVADVQTRALAAAENLDVLKFVSDVYRSLAVIQTTQEIYGSASEMQSMVGEYLLLGDPTVLKIYDLTKGQLHSLVKQLRQGVAGHTDQMARVDKMADLLDNWISTYHAPLIQMRKTMAASKTMKDLREFVARGDDKKYFDRFREKTDAFKAWEEQQLAERSKVVAANIKSTRTLTYTGMAAVIPLTLLIFLFLARNITRPITKAVAFAETVGGGDLTERIEINTRDELGRLGIALNRMAGMIQKQVGRVVESVNVLTSSVAQISASVSELAVGTRQTSAAVTETTTTVEEVRQAALVSGQKAKHVANTSLDAAHTAENGRTAVEQTIQGMRQIREQMTSIGETVVRLSDHSRAIDEIMDVVKDLADQSNLLAVNASIEAARAGDQGKGFAVVAGEIKNLAEQSEQATEQVRGILDETRKWVNAVVMASEQGAKVVDVGVEQSVQAEDSIRRLAESVNVSSQAASVIDQSAEQQATGVEQVSSAMGGIDEAMQRNLESTGQLETAAKRLEDLGNQLKGLVSQYRLE